MLGSYKVKYHLKSLLLHFVVIPSFVLFSLITPVFSQTMANVSVVFPLMAPRLSSHFGLRHHPIYRSIRHHEGVDLAAPLKSHVRVVADGIVIFADTYGGYGKLVTVRHKNGYVSLYGHLSEIRVNPGQKVDAGDIIGRVGQTGHATGPHLHFEWRCNGQAIDPLKVFPSLIAEAEG